MAKLHKNGDVTLSRKEAEAFGLIVCKHCHWPQNNHFVFVPRKCAHDPECPGFEPVLNKKVLQ